jgi:light-regulated signal transduction histidine kinase (bacteriophytochrome)
MEARYPEGIPEPSAASQLRPQIRRCEDEPIRIPGSIQQHGFLLLLNAFESHIVGASENVEEFLKVPLQLVLGAEIDSIVEREVLGALRALAYLGERPALVTYLGAFQMRGRLYSVVTHQVESQRIVEFELLDRLVSPDMTNQVFTNFVGMLSQLRSEQELCSALTRQVRDLTHFQRVMLYRFDEFGHGTVLSEENDGSLPSYLGLRFPASDIPQQARDLYVLNTVRIIPDATYTPSPLCATHKLSVPASRFPADQIARIDLSNSMLRSVSPVHVQYMRNMGTLSSMSISIVCEGKLWGLISGHHSTPHAVPYLVRSACDLLTKLVCTQLMSLRSDASLKKMVHFHGVQRSVLAHMAADNNYLNAMAHQMSELVQIADAGGVALVTGRDCRMFGNTPDESKIHRLAEWMDETHDLEVFESRSLSRSIGWAAEFIGVASGLLAIRISNVSQSYLMWFRPEVLRTVEWAGEPVATEDKVQSLHPRTSFASWKEEVSGTSSPWTKMEIQSAKDFRGAVMTISLKRAEEALELGEARFLQLTHALPHPVWTADDDGRLTYVNQRWLDEGLQRQGQWYEQEAILTEDQVRCDQTWKEAVAEGLAFELEIRFFSEAHKAGRWNLVRAVPFRANGVRAGWVGTCTDLTDRRQREAALRMTEKLALTGRMTSVVAHEINNPLEALTNLLYLLSSHVAGDDEARNYIGLAEGELQRISGITKQTLRWAREDLLKPEYGSAHNLILDVLRLYAGQIRNKEVEVVLEGELETPVYGTLGQISQIVANLISNAVQAVPVGGCIWLSYVAHPATTEFTVRDNGHGMSEETIRNLFQPFYSTKGDLGNGLGLYISHEIVERHGGSITVQSTIGEGTHFRFYLPLEPLQDVDRVH